MLKFIGDDQLDALATIKSKEELIEKSLDYFNHQHKELFLLQNQFAGSEGSRGIIIKLKFCINNAQ
jgi:CO dehydrogenase/acetyl-CoA synthase epsilon subunit